MLTNDLTGSAVNALWVELSSFNYEEVRMSIGQVADPQFTIHNVHSSPVKSLLALMSALAFDCHNGMMPVAWPAVCRPMDSAMKNAVAVEAVRKVVKPSIQDDFSG